VSQHGLAEEHRTIEELSEALADVFRTGEVGEVFTDDLFIDGHPPFWRFQLEGLETFASWLRGYVKPGVELVVVSTLATATGFLTEHATEHTVDGELITARELIVCGVRDGRIAEMTVYCSGDWDAELRKRHRAEAPMSRP
jgi:hypothetical protein